MVDMGKYTVSATFPHIIRKSVIKKKINKNTTVTTTTDRKSSSVSRSDAYHSSPRSVTTTDRMKHSIFSDASKCSVEIVPCPQVVVITKDRDERNQTVHNDRPLHSLGCFGQQFISGVIRRLFASPASEKYGITTSNVYSIGMMLRNVCEWELPFELSEDHLDNDNSGGTVAWRVHSRFDQLWAGIEHSLDRWVVDASKAASNSILSGPILNGPMAIKLVEKIVHSTLWEMGIYSLRFDIGIDDEDSSLCSVDNRTGWTTPRSFGCCQCTRLESL